MKKMNDMKIYECVDIAEGVNIAGYVTINEGVTIFSDVIVKKYVTIGEGVVLGVGATIGEEVEINKGVTIGNYATIYKGVVIPEGVRIGGGRKNITKCMCINGFGNTQQLSAYICDDGLIINIGCMNSYRGNNLEKTYLEINKKYSDLTHLYYHALRLVEEWYRQSKQYYTIAKNK